MNSILGVLLTWTIVMTSCDAQCYLTQLEITLGSQPEGCKDAHGVLKQFNTKWKTDDCQSCECTDQGTECCSLVKKPFLYDKNKCQEVFHKENCTYTVVEKENPLKPCEVLGYIG
ncbi:beta-microseminoprotein J1-like [Monodelphis domestica]|nr:beta-microseminoprotein J1-like [Monodelphis domestica]